MNKLATTKLSVRGQVVIPETIRRQLKLKAGNQFIVIAEKDVVILKIITKPSLNDFNELITCARTQAKKAKLNRVAVKASIGEARRKK
jgi:AbrB family looped-hinge helix DNA binding protein